MAGRCCRGRVGRRCRLARLLLAQAGLVGQGLGALDVGSRKLHGLYGHVALQVRVIGVVHRGIAAGAGHLYHAVTV